MTTSRRYADSEGTFGAWKDAGVRCPQPAGPPETITGVTATRPCLAPVRCRVWESDDGAYEDYQYRCDQGHVWWIEGADA